MENSMKFLIIFRIWACLTEFYWADFLCAGLDPMTDNIHYTNPLITETSPYLLQHAHNPVEWYPWSSQALKKPARKTGPSCPLLGVPPAAGAA
jgi:hypothetical protein